MRVAACVLGFWLSTAFPVVAAAVNPGETDMSIEAIDTARAALAEALNKAPLGFRRILFVSETPEGFAAYQPRSDNVFAPDEQLIVYTEPIGILWRKEGEEYSSKLVIDFEIRLPDGQVLAGQRGFGEFALEAREPLLEYTTQIKVDWTGAPAGTYILGLTIHDANSGKAASRDLPFEIK
jgi:hypothetical protein